MAEAAIARDLRMAVPSLKPKMNGTLHLQSLASGASTAAQASRKKAKVRRWVDSVPLPACTKQLGMKGNLLLADGEGKRERRVQNCTLPS